MATTNTNTKQQSPDELAAAEQARIAAAQADADAAAAQAAAEAAALAAAATQDGPKKDTPYGNYGRKLFVSPASHSQVNPLTNQKISHGQPNRVELDRWIEIQLDAKVLAEVSIED